jgi:uncharacterized lipoprotein
MRDTVERVRRATLLVAAVALVAGCGGGKSYTAKADAICKKYAKQTSALGQPTNVAELAAVADKTLPILDRAAKELAALQPPPDKRAPAERWLAQFRTLRADLREIRDQARAGNSAGLTAAARRAQQDNAKANELATRLGFDVCNKN